MTNNDILRRIRYTFNLADRKMIAIFALADVGVTTEQVINWLKKDEDKDQVSLTDTMLAAFLNGFITEKRGKKDGPAPAIEKKLNNNLILTKLKIALNLKAEEIISLLDNVGFKLSKPELSAFSRKPDHKHYRECKDQVLRNFLMALQKQFRPDAPKAHKQAVKTHARTKNTDTKPVRTQGARPQAGKIYHNPATAKDDNKADKANKKPVLKLKPEDIWGKQ